MWFALFRYVTVFWVSIVFFAVHMQRTIISGQRISIGVWHCFLWERVALQDQGLIDRDAKKKFSQKSIVGCHNILVGGSGIITQPNIRDLYLNKQIYIGRTFFVSFASPATIMIFPLCPIICSSNLSRWSIGNIWLESKSKRPWPWVH